MATFYLDLVGGNDANNGTSFALRWKTFASGATGARIAPGDTIRVMRTDQPTSLGMTAAWTDTSKTVTLNSALTANISTCESSWTASANVTCTTDSTNFKEGTKSASAAFASGFTTGLAAYVALGSSTDFSAYKQVSFWIRTSASIAASTLSLRLCSDTAGVTTVNTIAIPAIAATNSWSCITVDTGSALGSAIQSIALYADLDPGTPTVLLDNIIACKDATAADSLTLRSLIGKVHNLNWVASTAYSVGDIRKPTPANRNGLRYICTSAGTSDSSEPTWPTSADGTVTDGSVVWATEGLEDTWRAIQSINGTTVKLDNGRNTAGGAGRGYSGATETVTTYKREPYLSAGANATQMHGAQDSGTGASPIVFSGGWNTTDMSTQDGETWVGSQNSLGYILYGGGVSYVTFQNFGSVGGQRSFASTLTGVSLLNCHLNNADYAMYYQGIGGNFDNIVAVGTTTVGFARYWDACPRLSKMVCSSGLGIGIEDYPSKTRDLPWRDLNWIDAKNNGTYGVKLVGPTTIRRLTTSGNTTAGVLVTQDSEFIESSLSDSTPVASMVASYHQQLRSHNNGRVADAHLITWEGGTIASATDQRHTASGISWKFTPTNTIIHQYFPMVLPVAKVACGASSLVTVKIWARRDSANIKGKLVCLGGFVRGVETDVEVACEPSTNTWTEYTMTFTPSAAGVAELVFKVWDGVGTTNAYWIDDLTVTQA